MKKATKNSLTYFFIAFFFITVEILVITKEISFFVFATYFAMSLFAYFFYWKDKSAAIKGNRRISENTLHLLSLFGGWPGALLAQQKFRHKTKNLSFLIVFWITVAVNLSGLILLIRMQ